MACNYSNKFLPLVMNIARRVGADTNLLRAELAKFFSDPDTAMQDLQGLVTFESVREEQKNTNNNAPVKLNTKQAKIGTKEGGSISSAYLGRSNAYAEMIKNFRRSMLELSRIKMNFETGEVESFNSNSDSGNGVSILNQNILNYKLDLIKKIFSELGYDDLFEDVELTIRRNIITGDWNTADSHLNQLLQVVQMQESVPDSVYDAYVMLMNFDKLIKQECPFIEADERYGSVDGINKYKYVGASVAHFTGWTSSEFANSMDQASTLVKSILDYIPEANENRDPIEGSSIGLSGFYSVMSAMRNTLLYHAEGELLKIRKDLLKGTQVDLSVFIDAYINYLQSASQNVGNTSSYFDTHRTYLIGKLRGIQKYIFNSQMDKELKDIFNHMFFKNVQMSYVAYSYDPLNDKFKGTDLKASAINQQTYGLLGTIASSIYNYRTNPGLFQRIIGNTLYQGIKPKYTIKEENGNVLKNDRTGQCTITYNGCEFTFGPNNIQTTFEFQEFKDIFFDLFGYILPDNYVSVGKQINGENWDYKKELGSALRLGLQGVFNWGKLKYEDGNRNFPSNINDWYTEFAPIGKVISTIYGADTINVIKNVSKKNNLPLYGLTSLAYNFPFIMWNHMDDDREGNVYSQSFLFDQIDADKNVITRSIVGEPKVRSEIMYNGKLKSTSKLTVAEVTKLSILDDFFRNFADKEVGHIYLQNATFADKGTHFLVNYNLDTPIYGDKTLRMLIAEQMKSGGSRDTDLFRLMYDTRSVRINQLVENILSDYSKVFKDGTFNTLNDITAYIKRKGYSHSQVRDAFIAKNVNFYEEIHLSKGKVNETIALYHDTFSDESKLEERLNQQRLAFINDLETNRVKFSINSDSISKQIGDSYKKWVNPDGSIRLYEKDENGKVKMPPKLHPVLEGYFMANALLSNEYNEVMIGGVYAHSKNTESSRLIAQIKRSVIFGATMHSYAQGLDNGVADEVVIACMPDVQAYVQNIVGTEQTNDSMDGSGLCTMLQARLESNSLLDARVGYDKKSIGHDIDSKYARPSLLKWAVYAMTNARRRIAFGSNISQEILCKKAYSHGNIEFTTEELNSILKEIGPVYFKDTNTGKYYKIVSFKIEGGVIKRALQEVTEHGSEFSTIVSDSIALTNTLWDIDQLFGGAWAMTFNGDTLEYSESNVDALEKYVVAHQDAKTKQIGYLVNKSAMKVGIGNLNNDASWTDGSKLNTISMRTRYIGVQMDAEHHLDENEVTEMTQMISALSENGYTADIVNNIYTDIGNVIMEALKEYDAVISSDDPAKLYKLLGEIFIKSFENNDRDTLGLAQAFVLKATKALKENDLSFRLPFSAETVSGLFMSTVSSLLTKKGIRRKYEGFAGVLTPSYNMMQYYNISGQTMMYDRFTDLVRDSGITSYNTTGISQNVPTTKIISGGQSGVDTIGLEVGRELGLKTGGTTTPGFVRESGYDNYTAESLNSLFGLQEISSELQQGRTGKEFYLPRTEQNVLNSDATVYFTSSDSSAGMIATERFARLHKKPFIVNPTATELRAWLIKNNVQTLNVAGNRGSKLGSMDVASTLRSALDKSAISKAINDVYVNGQLNPFLVDTTQDQVDFEDTVVIFEYDADGNLQQVGEPIYIQSYSDYDVFKHTDYSGKVIKNFSSRPKNLKATNTKFKVDGRQYSIYELDSVREMFNFIKADVPALTIVPTEQIGQVALATDAINTLRTNEQFHFGNPFGTRKYPGVQVVVPTVKESVIAFEQWLKGQKYQDVEPERRQWILTQIKNGSLYGKTFLFHRDTVEDKSYGIDDKGNPVKYNYNDAPNHAHILQKLVNEAHRKNLQKWIQRDLRHLKKGREVMLNETFVVATDVQVTPAQLITGRYHAKEFMMDPRENVSDVLTQGKAYFVDKLTTKYSKTAEEPAWAEMVLYDESGEKYLVRTVNDAERATLMASEKYPKDTSIEKINGVHYLEDKKITSLENVSFHKYKDERTGHIWKVILVDSERSKKKLYRSSFFEFYRENFNDVTRQTIEQRNFERRIDCRADRMFKTFEQQLKMLGTRIPTQAMQSFMPMEIVGFTDSLVNDVYVPVQQFFLQGSDLDIDKVYLLGFGISASGKLLVNSKLADYVEYGYEDLYELAPPNGIEYEFVEEADDNTFVISDEEIDNERNWISLFNKIMASGKTKILATNSNASKFLTHLNAHSTTELSDQNIDGAIKNQVVHNVLKVATDPENQVIAQISVDAATVDLKKAAKTSHLAAYEKTITSDNPMTIFTMQVQNMVGREVIGVTAVALKQFFAKTAYYNAEIAKFTKNCLTNPETIQQEAERLWKLVVKRNPLTGRDTVFANLNFLDAFELIPNVEINVNGFTTLHDLLTWMQNEANENDAALTISGILTLATDNAKELILSKLNATSSLVDIYTYLTALGTDTKTIADIMIPGSFTYIAKLQEGDLFDNFTRNITIENAIKFYLGEYNFGINEDILRGLFGVDKKGIKNATLDSEKVQKAIDTCLAAIKANKKKEAEMRAYLRELAERGEDPSDMVEEPVQEADYEVDENGRSSKPVIPLSKLSAPEIYEIIGFLNECLERNKNRKVYAKNEEVDKNLRLVLNEVLPGVKEQSMMGKMAGINQGLKTKSFDKISFKQNVENYITDARRSYLQKQLWKAKNEKQTLEKNLSRERDPDKNVEIRNKLAQINQHISSLENQILNMPSFDLHMFIVDKQYQDAWIKTMEDVKHTDNILKIIVSVPHFKQMLGTWAVDETLLQKSSVRYKIERSLLNNIKPTKPIKAEKTFKSHTFKELEFNQVKQYVNDHLILNWLFDRGFTIQVPQDQIDLYNIKIYDAAGILKEIPGNELKLDSITGIDSFKHLMETWIVPELKLRFKDNAFIQALVQTSDNTKSGIRTYLKLPIQMMDIDKSVEMETKYNQYLNAFDDISTQMFAGMKIADLFYLYNLIVNKDSFGQKSMTRLFENLVNSEKGSFLVNDYNQWISELDASGDYGRLQMNIDDLKGRIAKYVPETKITGTLEGVKTPDSCFEVPHLAKSPIRITYRDSVEPQPELHVPSMLLFRNFIDLDGGEWNSVMDSPEGTVFLTDMDYDDSELELDDDTAIDYIWNNRQFLRKQKSFIYNGTLYINAENAGIGDMVHEWAHIVLAQMKWSDDPRIRDKYYNIVAKVADHPRFKDLAVNYPWAHGSDLQEEVLTNLFQMYIQNKMFADNFDVLGELTEDESGYYDGIVRAVEKTFKLKIGDNISLEDARISDLIQLFGDDFYTKYLKHDNSYILKKHQKISALKDRMVEEDMLKMICK